MMDIERSQQLGDIIQLSKKMLSHARDNKWERVVELEVQRREIVLRCFQYATAEQDSPEVAAAIKEILSLNQEVAELGRESQAQLGSKIHTHNVGRAAAAAYLNCAR